MLKANDQVLHMLASFKSKAHGHAGRDLAGAVAAIDRVMAVIAFNPDGAIITANENFSAAMGYALPEIQGRHHRMPTDPA